MVYENLDLRTPKQTTFESVVVGSKPLDWQWAVLHVPSANSEVLLGSESLIQFSREVNKSPLP